jgi:hypothetical protein
VVASSNPQWPADSEQAKKQAAAKTDGSCPSGDTSQDCRPSWFYRTFHSDEDKKTQ